MKNIRYHPNESKFQTIRPNILSTKLDDYKICLKYLYNAGFKQSANGKRLIWKKTENNMEMLTITLKSLRSSLVSSLFRPAVKAEPKSSNDNTTMNSYVALLLLVLFFMWYLIGFYTDNDTDHEQEELMDELSDMLDDMVGGIGINGNDEYQQFQNVFLNQHDLER